ncbi:MAG: flagellar hook-associated protein FlgK [Bacteroidales bacterium]|nr:flagellar hook-associated protein FlgK [Clostridium sp.]MCM1203825.1 flagellar hook-associated protein FlgK [Bacteroidales bacterium]
MAGTMGNFYVGVSGLQSHQYALNTTAHNITNAGTEGYSRQQIILTDLSYTRLGNTAIGRNQSGLGTKLADVRLVRDDFVDKAYRKELGREQFYQTKYDVVAEVQNYFGELEGSDFRTYMKNLWTAAQELQKESNSIVTRSSYIANAVTFAEQADEIYKQLITYQRNLNTEILDQVDRINELAETIHDLNQEIVKVEAGGIESANDYRDQRDAALDELSGLISISYHENKNGQVDVYAEHRTLVSLDRAHKIGTRQVSESCDYLVPIWESDRDDVFNLYRVPGPETRTDVGSLKGIIMSRGDWIARYTDIPVAPQAPEKPLRANYEDDTSYNQALTQYQTDYQQYQIDYQQFTQDRDYYNTHVEPYTVNNILAQFDQLIHGIATKINDILCPNKEITIQNADGSRATIKVLDTEKAGYGMGDPNQIQGTELFKRKNIDRYRTETVTVVKDDGSTESMEVQIYNEENPDDYLSLYSSGNIEVNDDLIKNPSLLPLTNLKSEELQKVADQLIQVWNEDFQSIGPNSLVVNNFMGYYKEFVGDFANKGKTYSGIAEAQNKAVQEIDGQRQMVVGVSTDEELSHLIRFQQGFNASSRYFTVVSEMVEHLIERLG